MSLIQTMGHSCLLQCGKGRDWEQNQQTHPPELGIAAEYDPGDSAVLLSEAEWPGYFLKFFIFPEIYYINVCDIFNKNREWTGLDG